MSRAVWLAAAAAILPVAAMSAAETPKPAAGLFKPTAAPLILTRTLRHMMHDGTAIVTRRSYRVQITPEGNGFEIAGTLSEVSVEAPPGLEALAALERRRPDPGIFPIKVDAAGMIVPAADPEPSRQQRQAIGTASADIARMNLASTDAEQAQGFVSQFQTKPYRTYWPLDLFHPASGTRREQRAIALDGGQQGQVTTVIEASADRASGLVSDFTRTVVTDLGGDKRTVIEEWTLAPAP